MKKSPKYWITHQQTSSILTFSNWLCHFPVWSEHPSPCTPLLMIFNSVCRIEIPKFVLVQFNFTTNSNQLCTFSMGMTDLPCELSQHLFTCAIMVDAIFSQYSKRQNYNSIPFLSGEELFTDFTCKNKSLMKLFRLFPTKWPL